MSLKADYFKWVCVRCGSVNKTGRRTKVACGNCRKLHSAIPAINAKRPPSSSPR
jgi:hypothetical protein